MPQNALRNSRKRQGRKSAAQTPSPKADRIYGSSKNPKRSASSTQSGASIQFTDSIINGLKNKMDAYNKKHPNNKVTLSTLKAVFRRGAGAYSKSHRPTITGGVPNTRNAWAYARVNKFLLKKGGTKVKAAYVQDDDLMEKGGQTDNTIIVNKYIIYIGTPETTEVVDTATNEAEAFKIYEETDRSDSENPNAYGLYKELNLESKTYQFIGELEEEESLQDYMDEDYYEDNSLWILVDEDYKDLERITFPQVNEKTDLLVSEVRSHYNAKNGYARIPIGTEFLTLRIKDHTGNVQNKSKGDSKYFLSVVISEKDPTSRFKQSEKAIKSSEEIYFGENSTLVEILAEINEHIDYYKAMEGVKYAEGGLIAPNGKPSNLTPEQYKLVRTPQFKAWFGDWENDPENASKVVDENGEPKVYYQGQFYAKYPKGNYLFEKDNNGIFFSSNKRIAESYGVLKSMFIKVLNPKDVRNYYGYDNKKISYRKRNDNKYWSKSIDEKEYINSDPTVVKFYEDVIDKYANKVLEILDKKNGKLYQYKNKKEIKEFLIPTSNKGFKFLNFKYKSHVWDLVAKYIKDSKYDGLFATDEDYRAEDIADSIVVYNSNQIKLADGSNTTFDANNPDIRYEGGGLIAPNGKPSNLTPEQYKLVRTPQFKAWFGDWENDPENASKVVDENGEPLVVYHGFKEKWWLKNDLFVFNPKMEGKNTKVKKRPQGAIYFSSNYNSAKSYSNELIYPFFLNFRKPKIIDANFQDMVKILPFLYQRKADVDYYDESDLIVKNTYDYYGFKYKKEDLTDIFITSESYNKIKLADGSNTTFDANNPDVRYANGGSIDETAQLYIDIISMNPDNPKYQKYKDLLKQEYGIDYELEYANADEKLLNTASLNDIKDRSDFLNYDNYVKYINDIFRLRGFHKNQPKHIEGIVGLDKAKEVGRQLGFNVVLKEYKGDGNYAEQIGDEIRMPQTIDINTLIHEIGHYFDHELMKEYEGLAKTSTYASSLYRIQKSDEVFAENFMHYFIAPKWLQDNLPEVYEELDKKIPRNVKSIINHLIEEMENLKYNNGGDIKLLAPNGKPSNLTPEQYKLVRTPQFKAWFGDWENDPKNASKVVDENGEPMVVYHGSDKKFNAFKIDPKHPYSFWAVNKEYALEFTKLEFKNPKNARIYECFLNIKTPFDVSGIEFRRGWKAQILAYYIKERLIDDFKKGIIKQYILQYDYEKLIEFIELHERYEEDKMYLWHLFRLDGSAGEKEFQHYRESFRKKISKKKRNFLKNFMIKYGYDGITQYESVEGIFHGNYLRAVKKDKSQHSKVWAVFKPTQIKLADGSNTTFDGSNADIRYKDGGELFSAPPKNEAEYIPLNAYRQSLINFYYDQNGNMKYSSREVPYKGYLPKVGSWRIDSMSLLDGRMIDKLVVLDMDDLIPVELSDGKLDVTKRGDDETYANWLKQGLRSIPIEVVETPSGKFKIIDGHRRYLAHKLAGKDKIEAWVSPNAISPRGTNVGLTFELANDIIANHLSYKKGGLTFEQKYGKYNYVNLTPADLDDYAEDMYNLIQNAYSHIGGHLEFQTPEAVRNTDLNFWVASDIDQDPEMDVLLGGKKTNYGTKITTLAQDGERASKVNVAKKAYELLSQKGFYAEVDEALAEKLKVPIVTDERIIRKVIAKPDIEMNEDGTYYRNIQGKRKKKVLVGMFEHLKWGGKLYRKGGATNQYLDDINILGNTEVNDPQEASFEKGGKVQSDYAKWKKLVNMSASELEAFYNSDEGKVAGLTPSQAKSQGIDSGRESARWILKMKKTPYSEWTPQMHRWANKQISFISRMSGMKGDLVDDKGRKTRKHLSLLIWGHNPKKSMQKGGGLTEKKSISGIAKKHNTKLEYLYKQLKEGIKVEMEHTDNRKIAEKIALDHLDEMPDYYVRLKKMESHKGK